MKKYVFTEAWRNYKTWKRLNYPKPFSYCLANSYRIAKALRDNDPNFVFYTDPNYSSSKNKAS